MQPLFTEEGYEEAKSNSKLSLRCHGCNGTFNIVKKEITRIRKGGSRTTGQYCSKACLGRARRSKELVSCKQCTKEFFKLLSQIKKSLNHFCSRSCACTYHNTHKIHGTRRSKLEAWLEEELIALYPEIEFHFNRKDAINSELDIYLPEYKLAFELNGIFHYEPIFGAEKLSKIQNNDERKFQACVERGISFCTIDSSALKHFKRTNAQKYLDIVVSVIEQRL